MQHKDLARGRWKTLTFMEQMAHIGSEVERALSWRKKGNNEYARLALYRALELMDLTLAQPMGEARLRELARVRSLLVDDFDGTNIYRSTDISWQRYFRAFTWACKAVSPVV